MSLRRALFLIPGFVLVYLATAAIWASASLDALVAQIPATPASSALSAKQKHILLKIEDPSFYEHAGLSLADGQGVVTLSSALAREVFLSHRNVDGVRGAMQSFYRGVFNCCKRIDFGRDMMALVLNAKVPKDKQLALFVATVYMGSHEGRQLSGLEQAADAYAGKPLNQLSDAQFAALAAMIKAPNQFHPARHRAAYDQRVARVAAIVAGTCQPTGWFDTSYEHCTP